MPKLFSARVILTGLKRASCYITKRKSHKIERSTKWQIVNGHRSKSFRSCTGNTDEYFKTS